MRNRMTARCVLLTLQAHNYTWMLKDNRTGEVEQPGSVIRVESSINALMSGEDYTILVSRSDQGLAGTIDMALRTSMSMPNDICKAIDNIRKEVLRESAHEHASALQDALNSNDDLHDQVMNIIGVFSDDNGLDASMFVHSLSVEVED